MIDLFEHIFYFANFLKIICSLFKVLEKDLPLKGF